jgi:hypothetical protein
VEVEFGLSFTAAGGVIMAGVAGQATLKVTLSWDTARHPQASTTHEGEPDGTGEPEPGEA